MTDKLSSSTVFFRPLFLLLLLLSLSLSLSLFSNPTVLGTPLSLALSLSPRQTPDTDSYRCGSHTYQAQAINQAVNQGVSYLASGDTVGADAYPHPYHDREGFSFPTPGPWYEFPIMASGAVYTGDGSPGADRVIFDTDGNFDAVLTHTGARGNGFEACTDEG